MPTVPLTAIGISSSEQRCTRPSIPLSLPYPQNFILQLNSRYWKSTILATTLSPIVLTALFVEKTTSCKLSMYPSLTRCRRYDFKKCKRYHKTNVILNSALLIQFVSKIIGRHEPVAKDFLKSCCGFNKRLQSDFITDVSYPTEREIGRIISNAVHQLVVH